ncbi:MAG: hypothetical protein K2I81_03980 [Alphaproteobacteria bacterium]|nr:hypothetical protein [Alphaproteobacteria bacterium]
MIGCVLPAAAMAMADRTAPVYGRPTLYGEYEISEGDARRAAVMYGMVPKNAAEKMPIKPKKIAPKKSVKKKKTVKKASVKKKENVVAAAEPEMEVIVVPPRAAVSLPIKEEVVSVPAKKAPMPSAEALAIAAAAVEDVPSLDAFCTHHGTISKGTRPEGIVLMPGRPDLMSCVEK